MIWFATSMMGIHKYHVTSLYTDRSHKTEGVLGQEDDEAQRLKGTQPKMSQDVVIEDDQDTEHLGLRTIYLCYIRTCL